MRKNFGMRRLYYSISEVSKITELEQYVLRYWESEFEQLRPAKNSAGNRVYTNKDIKLILYIKKLLREDKFTIEGAKQHLQNITFKDEDIISVSTQNQVNRETDNNELRLYDTENDFIENDENESENHHIRSLIEIRESLKDILNSLS